MEIYKTLTVFRTEMECPNCQRGMMMYTGTDVMTQGGEEMFLHACNFCGLQNVYEKRYPSNIQIGECREVHEQ